MSTATAALADTAAATRLVLANRNLRRVNLALAGSMIGDAAFSTAVAVYIFSFGGAAAVGAYVGVRLALTALGLPFLMVLAERVPRLRFMVGADLVRAVIVAGSAVLIWVGGPPIVVLVLAVVAGLVGSPFRPVQGALLPSLCGAPRELTAANAVSSTLESLSFFVGPALAGVLLVFTDTAALFVLNAVSFLWSALMLSGIVVSGIVVSQPDSGPDAGKDVSEETSEAAGAEEKFLTQALAGFRHIFGDRSLSLVIGLCCAQTIVAGASTVFTVYLAVQVLGLGDSGVGYLNSILGVGSIIGGLVAIGRSARGSVGLDYGVGVLLWTLPPLLIAIWPSVPATFIAFALVGFANPLVDVNLMTLIQRITPEPLLGKVFGALESAFIAAMALGAFVMPSLLHLGIRWGLVVISAPFAALALLGLRGLLRIDATVGEPEHLDLIRALPLFQTLPPADQEALARQLRQVRVSPGDVVIRAGEPGDRFYLVGSGSLDALRGETVLSSMGAGDYFGEIALLRQVPRTATVTATSPSVLYTLEPEAFLTAVGADAEAGNRAEVLVNVRLAR